MQTSSSNPIYCPVMIGRTEYLNLLTRSAAQARQGIGQVVTIAGEPGIGKTRLIREAKADARQQQMLILEGECFRGDFNFPFAPVVDLFRRFISMVPAEEVRSMFTDATLLKILPELNWLTPPMIPPAEPETGG